MLVSKNNTVFVYRLNDPDSYEIALEYQSLHSLNSNQLIGIDCSSTEVLPHYSQFYAEVESQIKDMIKGMTVFCIVLGYNIPGGFKDGEDVISSTSRISRINHQFSKKTNSDLFDRRLYKRFDEKDAERALIVSRIDGESKIVVLNQLSQSRKLINQLYVSGSFYFDPYSDKVGKEADLYLQDLQDFQVNILPELLLTPEITTFIDAYIDTFHPYLEKDCFYWGWFTDRGSDDFFHSTSTSRSFFYNADFDGAESIKDKNPDKWVQLAIRNGYTNTAGAMSNPSISGFLRPSPFFESIYNKSTIGESFLFSNPFYDWTICFFGDPLIYPTMQDAFVGDTSDTVLDKQWYNLLRECERSLAYQTSAKNQIQTIENEIVESKDLSVVTDLLPYLTGNIDLVGYRTRNYINKIVNCLINYVITNRFNGSESFDSYLSRNNFKISQSIFNIIGIKVKNSNILPQGSWSVEFVILDETEIYSEYNFELQVSKTEDFSEIIYNIDSSKDKNNWYYEIRQDEYLPFVKNFIGSNYVGMHIKYESNKSEYLQRGEFYFFRIRQKTEGTEYSYRTIKEVIYT